jgi:site-specific DNA-methyltransferase (adenine-specific)
MFERIVWRKDGQPGRYNKRFRLDHEDVLVFSKGEPGTFDKSEILIPCKHAGSKMHGYRKSRSKDRANEYAPVVAEFKCPGTVWYIPQSRVEQNSVKSKHPATFPDKLARDLILCFSKVGDTVLDPMVGSGTTCVEAAKAERHSIGIDLAYQNIQIARLVKEAGIRPTIKLPTLPRRK